MQRGRGAYAAIRPGGRDAMRYDELGFPIPADFDLPGGRGRDPGRPGARGGRPATPGWRKRFVVLALLGAVIVPGLVAPAVLPVLREAVVQWSAQRAIGHEAGGRSAAAIAEVGRALAWSGGDGPLAAELLCWRASLRLDVGDAPGAAVDAARAVEVAPAAVRPRCVRALVNVVLDRPDAALADAAAAVEIAGPGDPEALNHRAYVRALVGRDLPEALADIDAAMAGDADPSAAFLDTRGYLLHLLGRHQEAIDQLNLAITATEARQRDLAKRMGPGLRVGAARELRSLDRDLAVMHHHRGLACRAAGLLRQAEQDFEIAERKGYDPRRGVM